MNGGEELKYCSKCNKVYPDGVICECVQNKSNWDHTTKMIELDCEPICKCGSSIDLIRHDPYKWISQNKIDPAYCECAECDRKRQAKRDREDSMRYLVLDDYQGEDKFCDSTDEVEEFLKYYTEDSDRDTGKLDGVLVLKLEPLTAKLQESDFKPQHEYVDGGYQNKQEPNTHIVICDGEKYRVEEVMVPELEYDGGRQISW